MEGSHAELIIFCYSPVLHPIFFNTSIIYTCDALSKLEADEDV